ncbi:hypothetical protein HMPREF0297_0251 [Corynebacterium jeikeium ATCC 43734]|nr:hypothetical protein HMPREF0297_0251 [Corynebacterium jeikeium ATCC 43734]OOD30765.1 hypothetical protein BWP03_06825 [Corynebacterium jeikeium]
MDMNALFTVLGTVAVALVGGFFTLMGQRASSRSQEKAAEVTTRADEWSKLLAETKAYADERLEGQQQQIEELQADMRTVKQQLADLKARYRAALETIRRWLRDHPNHRLDIPEEIRDDLKNL